MIKQVVTIFINKFLNKVPEIKPLGRWNINYCPKITNTKIDLANEDHCGPCGEYNIKNTKNLSSSNN